MFHLWTNSI